MEMPNKRIYTYCSHPELPAPTRGEIVSSVLKEKLNGPQLILL
jgi:hypothetical protein